MIASISIHSPAKNKFGATLLWQSAKFINSQIKAFGKTEGFKELNSDAEKAVKVIDTVNEV